MDSRLAVLEKINSAGKRRLHLSGSQIGNSKFKYYLLKAFTLLGMYVPFCKQQNMLQRTEFIAFKGDIPAGAGDKSGQYRLEYKVPRDLEETTLNIVYTPSGAAWQEGKILQRYCLSEPSIKQIILKPKSTQIKVVEQGTLIQVQTPFTYGDWVSEHLMCLVRTECLLLPLLLPQHIMARAYVRRDLARLGIEAQAVTEAVLIKKALVLHKTRYSHYVTQQEVDAYRVRMKINPAIAVPGSILYLSRKNVKGESVQRAYPSDKIEAILSVHGVAIIDTNTATLKDYQTLASKAETVICDFGSAYLNLLEWNTKNIIVLYTDEWWDSCSLFLGKALRLDKIIYRKISNEMSHATLESILTSEISQLKVDH